MDDEPRLLKAPLEGVEVPSLVDERRRALYLADEARVEAPVAPWDHWLRLDYREFLREHLSAHAVTMREGTRSGSHPPCHLIFAG